MIGLWITAVHPSFIMFADSLVIRSVDMMGKILVGCLGGSSVHIPSNLFWHISSYLIATVEVDSMQ